MNKNKIHEWQQKVRERPKVWAVYERYEGEEHLCDVYDTPDAAQIHADWLNSPQRSVRVKAIVSALYIHTAELARDRFGVGAPVETRAAPETEASPCVHDWDPPVKVETCAKCGLEKHTGVGFIRAVRPVSEGESRP